MLVRVGFAVVLVLVNVSGFCPVLAREWHGHSNRYEATAPGYNYRRA
jgi:hypothetical protein